MPEKTLRKQTVSAVDGAISPGALQKTVHGIDCLPLHFIALYTQSATSRQSKEVSDGPKER
jgi:hypothetical protein